MSVMSGVFPVEQAPETVCTQSFAGQVLTAMRSYNELIQKTWNLLTLTRDIDNDRSKSRASQESIHSSEV